MCFVVMMITLSFVTTNEIDLITKNKQGSAILTQNTHKLP